MPLAAACPYSPNPRNRLPALGFTLPPSVSLLVHTGFVFTNTSLRLSVLPSPLPRARRAPAVRPQVQRNWMYLENIFIGSEDIRKQLPQESQMFDGVHGTFTRLMKQLFTTGNCQKACTASGVPHDSHE